MKFNGEPRLRVKFIDDNTVSQIRDTPNRDILRSSFGKGLLKIRKKGAPEDNGIYSPSLSPLQEDPQDSDIYFKPTALIEETDTCDAIFGFSTPRKSRNNASHDIFMKRLTNGKSPSTPVSNKTPKSCRTPRTPSSVTRKTPRTPTSVTCQTPKTPGSSKRMTPKARSLKLVTPKSDLRTQASTPYSFRRKVTKRLLDVAFDDGESEDDFEDSDADGGEYAPSDAEESEEESSSSNTEDDCDTPKRRSFPGLLKHTLRTPLRTPRRGREPKVDIDMAGSSDDYFLHNSDTAKCVTSDHTLNRLETPRLGPEAIRSLLEGRHGSVTCGIHEREMEDLLNDHMTYFPHWMTLLCEGFSIFLCGVGSKKNLLSKFQVNFLCDFDHLVINGFFPSLTLRSILVSIAEDILWLESHPQGINELLRVIQLHYNQTLCDPLFLVIHNIDGPMLRVEKTQQMLSQLASLRHIHIIASIDHINSPLMFDSTKYSAYNPLWFDATTLAPYAEETSYENSLLVQQSGALALSSLFHVFKSLTVNAKGIFMLLAKHQLLQKDISNYPGMAFGELYQRCRESFLVNSDLTLRAQLTEFKDHKVIKMKKGFDGVENLLIPLDVGTLQEFIDQQDDE